jgi:hypothetical protein
MGEKSRSSIHIAQLNLRISTNSADSAHRVLRDITGGLARRIPEGVPGRLGALNVRVGVPRGATEAEMSEAVTGAIVKALRNIKTRS